jgi:DnaK suppressor protein
MTPTRLSSTDIGTTLRQRRSELQREIDAAANRSSHAGRDAADVHDAKDDADFEIASLTADAEQQRDRDELRRVNAALERLAAGTYGQCVACGEPIDPRRLQAEPASARCVACQARLEAAG